MDLETTPDCPECHGEGSVPFDDEHPDSLSRRPCGACWARFDETHCALCRKRLPKRYQTGRDSVGSEVRVCSKQCAAAWNENIRASWTPLIDWRPTRG